MNITNKYITNNRPYEKRAKTTAIAVHYIGNPGTSAEANRNYFQNNIDDVSSNYIIGLNGEIICCIPPDEVSWCTCQANAYSPSIECCHPDSTGKLNSKTYNSLVELCAYLCKKYKLDETDLIRHYDVTGKVCPKGFVPKSKGGSDDNSNNAWKKFKADVKAKLGGTATTASTTAANLYRVRKTWADASSQIGAFSSLENAKKACKAGYTVYDKNGKAVYTKAADSTIKVGSKVRVKSGAKDYNGNSLAAFVYKSTYTVMEISGSRAVIGVNGAVTAAVHINNLIKV